MTLLARFALGSVFALAAASLGCAPGIGDECETSVDCSQGGERLCDITQPGGYCTIFNCEPGDCPDDSVCIAFGAQPSAVAACDQSDGLSRFARSFCMATCSSGGDCRSGYDCIDVGAPGNPWAAVVVDRGESGKVCIPPPTSSAIPEDRESEVCTKVQSGSDGSGGMSGGGMPAGGGASGGDPSGGGTSGGG
jgi:hypothetical protein